MNDDGGANMSNGYATHVCWRDGSWMCRISDFKAKSGLRIEFRVRRINGNYRFD